MHAEAWGTSRHNVEPIGLWKRAWLTRGQRPLWLNRVLSINAQGFIYATPAGCSQPKAFQYDREQTLWGRALSCNLKTWTPCSGGIKPTRPAHVLLEHNQDTQPVRARSWQGARRVRVGNGERVCMLQSGGLQPPRRDQFVHRRGAWTDGNTTTPNDPMTVSCSVTGAHCC